MANDLKGMNRRSRRDLRSLLAGLLWLIVALPATPAHAQTPAPTPAPAAKIEWFTTYTRGIEEARKRERPTLLVFGAEWCGWCTLMERDVLTDSRVAKLATDFVAIHIDVEKDQKTAFLYSVSALPRIVALNKYGEIIADRTGFMDATQLYDVLKEARENAFKHFEGALAVEVPAALKELETFEKDYDRLQETIHADQLVPYLLDTDPDIRARAAALIVRLGERANASLVTALASPCLSLRIAAGEILTAQKPAIRPFDPWAARAERKAAYRPWRAWLSHELERGVPPERAAALATQILATAPQAWKQRKPGAPPSEWKLSGGETCTATAVDTDGDGTAEALSVACGVAPRLRLVVTVLDPGGTPREGGRCFEHAPQPPFPTLVAAPTPAAEPEATSP